MEDLFYFSKSSIELEDIAQIARENGFHIEYFTYPNDDRTLRTYYDARWFWEWTKLNAGRGDLDGFEPSDRKIIDEYGPLSAIDIEHHVDDEFPKLLALLKQVMTRFGGWVGCDTDNLEPIHTADNIEELRCPYHEDSSAS